MQNELSTKSSNIDFIYNVLIEKKTEQNSTYLSIKFITGCT